MDLTSSLWKGNSLPPTTPLDPKTSSGLVTSSSESPVKFPDTDTEKGNYIEYNIAKSSMNMPYCHMKIVKKIYFGEEFFYFEKTPLHYTDYTSSLENCRFSLENC